jgi:hypothetical protein
VRRIALVALALAAVSVPAQAQLDPSDHWKTIDTQHFHIHFPRGLDSLGRRAAVDAERAFAELSSELKPPRSKIDLVVSDNVDYVNGYATSFPSNRIVVFAHPPIDTPELRNYNDWLRLVITHELTHVFHLDRADGLWRLGRSILGRHPALFPNNYLPSWVVEGLAVYYESRITGAGRLEGTEHYMIARAAAEANHVPRIGELSRETSRFPGGEVVYSYGSLILDYLSRTRGADKIPKFVNETSKDIFPLSLNRKAKRAFGISFENAWRDWRDSIVREANASPPLPGWKELTHDGRYVNFPRWMSDTSLIYAAANGKEVISAYSVTTGGDVKRLSRRNSPDVNVPLPDGSIVFGQPDFTDPFHYLTDLYIEKNGDVRRLTRGARISQPDATADGRIVAVQNTPASSILVSLSPPYNSINRLQAPQIDVQYTEPRWSPDGSRIAAIRIDHGFSSVVILQNNAERAVTRVPAILSSLSWARNGNELFVTSTTLGAPQIWRISADPNSPATSFVSNASTGAFSAEQSPSGHKLAALSFKFDGYHLGYAPYDSTQRVEAVARISPRVNCTTCRLRDSVASPLALNDVPQAHGYSPWRSLAPRYWEPVLSASSGSGAAIGAATSGEDVIGRHAYFAQAAYNTDDRNTEGFLSYRYGGLGQPFLDFSAEQFFDHFDVTSRATGERIADLSRRTRDVAMSASFTRPRVRTFASFAAGAELESRSYSTDPDTVISHLAPVFAETRNYPSVFASASFANTKRPALSISREDGISLSAMARERWQSGSSSSASRSVIGVSSLYKSLDLPGFAHHVIAIRAAGGYADNRAISTFNVGGVSGGTFDVIEGVSLGAGRRNFGVRGFPPSAEQGTRALAGTLEYRAPIAAPSKRVPFIPVLFDRISAAAFGDAGRAFCPADALSTSAACAFTRAVSPWLASVGAEVNFDTAVQYDIPVRFRAGIAVPVKNRELVDAKSVSLYFTAGSFF